MVEVAMPKIQCPYLGHAVTKSRFGTPLDDVVDAWTKAWRRTVADTWTLGA